MFSKEQTKKLITLDTLILTASVLLFGANFYFACIIRNVEVKETFVALAILGILLTFITSRILIKDIKLLPKKVKTLETMEVKNQVLS